MLDRLITDIDKSLDAGAYIAALSLILTLPDICGKAMYKDEKNNKSRYIEWYDEYIGSSECRSAGIEDEIKVPYLSGEVIYQLRCSISHQGTPNVIKEKIKESRCKIDHFVLVVEKKKELNFYVDSSSYEHGFAGTFKEYHLNIRRLWFVMKCAVKKCYDDNKEKFDFFNYTIVDKDELDERRAYIERLNESLQNKYSNPQKSS